MKKLMDASVCACVKSTFKIRVNNNVNRIGRILIFIIVGLRVRRNAALIKLI
jgi:hypothetical protein